MDVTDLPGKATVLIVDDTPDNLTLMSGLLMDDYLLKVANSGEKALKIAASGAPPDLILLDIMMPGLSGYDVCRELKKNPATRNIPVIFVTALTEIENEEAGLTMGAVDYITKPISPPILLARVKNHLALRRQAVQLEQWNRVLEQRVADGVAEQERLSRLRRFFSPAVAELLLGDNAENPWKARRREIVVVFLDLRGYTSFTEAFGADEVMRVLGEFHSAMGELIMTYGATLERFTGDGMMVFFNAPVEIPDPAIYAVRMAVEMSCRHAELQETWRSRGYCLDLGIGIAQGIATIGAIGFEGRRDYGAIGRVTNLAARLCGEAKGGQILVCGRVAENAAAVISFSGPEKLVLKGFSAPLDIFGIAATS